jgi:hypothetical protein
MIALKKAQTRERHFPIDGCFFSGPIYDCAEKNQIRNKAFPYWQLLFSVDSCIDRRSIAINAPIVEYCRERIFKEIENA